MLTSRRIVEGFDNSTEMNKLLPNQARKKEQQNEVTAEGREKKKYQNQSLSSKQWHSTQTENKPLPVTRFIPRPVFMTYYTISSTITPYSVTAP